MPQDNFTGNFENHAALIVYLDENERTDPDFTAEGMAKPDDGSLEAFEETLEDIKAASRKSAAGLGHVALSRSDIDELLTRGFQLGRNQGF